MSTRLHSGYVAWYVSLTAALLLGDLLDGPAWARLPFWCAFLAVEIIGAFVRRGLGDTFTEFMGWLLRREPGLLPVAVAWMVFFIWQAVEVLPWGEAVEAASPVPELGLVALGCGAVLWWPVHLAMSWWRGRHG